MHDHSHAGHSHAPADFGRAFALGVALNTGFVVLEAAAGWITGSLALLADAGHNLSDVAGLLLAWGAAAMAKTRPTATRTYGMGRSTILASLANAVLLLLAVGAIVWEAAQRFAAPQPIAEWTVAAVAAAGILVNGFTAWLFFAGRKDDLNIRGAYLHMAADAGVSLGVVLAAFLVMATGWLWVDPAVSIVIAVVIAWGTWGLLTESTALALDGVPRGLDHGEIESFLGTLPGVTAVHDLHVWALSTTETALTAHVVRPDAGVDDAFLSETAAALRTRFGIGHTTLQVERGDGCAACSLVHPAPASAHDHHDHAHDHDHAH
ncbi:Cadmium, cobalt and zinc/H(+)-K(+) antiporter [Alphaproteobacteria bacterium SO-S41]|nr:Cadmium, cobalt and zinc/H(+)-K(+) antiporter [Alphaproteobacteria bacterium SO-S41]